MSQPKYNPPQNKTPYPRYFTFWLHFPKDSTVDCYQNEFIHDLEWEFNHGIAKEFHPEIKNELRKKGAIHFKDEQGVTHRIVIEKIKRKTSDSKYLPDRDKGLGDAV